MSEQKATATLPSIERQPQRQDSLRDQLEDLHIVASRLGMHDACDWLWAQFRAMDNGRSGES